MIDPVAGEESTAPQSPSEKLEAFWDANGTVELDAFLADWPDLDTRTLAEVVMVDQRERWRRSIGVSAESYFERFPRLKDDLESALGVVYGEILAAIETRVQPKLGDYQARFPFLAEMLAMQWEVHDAFQTRTAIPENRRIARDAESPRIEPGGYEVYEEIGRGVLGVVHRALHRGLDLFVALKMLQDPPPPESEAFERFLKEARLMAKLEHPRIVRVLDFGRHEGRPFIAMELVKGQTLEAMLNGQVLAPKDAARLLLAVTEGVAFAHRNRIIHRDLKPANILLDANGDPKITDFGLAKQAAAGLSVTTSGGVVGTLAYMSPEQAMSQKSIGPRSDIYSLGAILYQMLTGRPPHLAPSFAETLLLVIRQRPISPKRLNSLVPADLAAICMKCLEKEPARRYASADDLHDDLQRFLNGERPRSIQRAVPPDWHRAWLPTTLLVGASLGAIVIWLVASSYLSKDASVRPRETSTAEFPNATAPEPAQLARNDGNLAPIPTEMSPDRVEWRRYSDILERAYVQLGGRDPRAAIATLETARRDFRGPEFGLLSNLVRSKTGPRDQTPTATNDSSPSINGTDPEAGILRVPTIIEDQLQIAFHPDGRTIAAPNPRGGFDLWNVADGSLRYSFRDELRGTAVCFTADGSRMFTGGETESIRVWKMDTGELVKSIDTHGWTFSLAHHPALPEIAVGSGSGAVSTVNTETGALKIRFSEQRAPVVAIGYSPDGHSIVTAAFESNARVWDRESRREVLSISMSKPTIRLAISPDGQRLLTSTWEHEFDLWDVRDGGNLGRFVGHAGTVTGVAFSSDGERIFSCSFDGTVRVWHPRFLVELLKIQVGPELTQLAVSRDGASLAVTAKDGVLRIWNTRLDDETKTLAAPSQAGPTARDARRSP